MRRHVCIAAAIVLVGGMCALRSGEAVSHAASLGASPTVFGQGAELHLFPLWPKRDGQHVTNVAHVGTVVRAVGLGFHPGQSVHIIYAVPRAQFVLSPVARATVDAQGRFDARFTVSRTMDRGGPGQPAGRYGGPVQPLMVEAFEGASPGVGRQHAYAVSVLLVYFP